MITIELENGGRAEIKGDSYCEGSGPTRDEALMKAKEIAKRRADLMRRLDDA